MKTFKVMTIVGTRPEIIRLSRVMARLDETTNHIIVHTGQNYDYELNEIFFKDLEVRKPDIFLDAAAGTPIHTIAGILKGIDTVLDEQMPDALLILGDTNSCLAALPAKRKKIPVFHMEAGNRCFDQRVPEEINRKIVDHISDINLPYSDIAREYLLREGLPPDRIIKTGSPMFEVLRYYSDQIEQSMILEKFELVAGEYFVISAHREENIDNDGNFKGLVNLLNDLAGRYKREIIMSVHPRTRKRFEEEAVQFQPEVQLLKPLGFFDYNKLQKNAFAALSDSGTISEEASILQFPALNIRDTHERPEGMEEAAAIMTGLSTERIMQALELLQVSPKDLSQRVEPVRDYSVPNVSEKIVRIILSYTDYINRTVWYKQ